MSRILLTIFLVLLTLTALGCERRLAGAGARPSVVRHIVAVCTASRAVDGGAGAPRGLREARDGSLRVGVASPFIRGTALDEARARGRSLWLSSGVDEDDDGSRSPAGPGGDDPIAPTCAAPVPDAVCVDGLGTSSGPIASGVGPALGHLRITKPPPRARARA